VDEGMNSIVGYAGRLLHIDLSKHQQRVEELLPEKTRSYIGGSGLAAQAK
jgi:aldehyde:ferredoxin oxidoreductase